MTSTMGGMMTNKDVVWNWLEEAGPGRYGVDEVWEGIKATGADLDRRQTITALHGLAEYALEGRLHNIGKGRWAYDAERTVTGHSFRVEAAPERYAYPEDRPRRLEPGATLGEGTVISVMETSRGFEYLVRDHEGALYSVVPIFEYRILPRETQA